MNFEVRTAAMNVCVGRGCGGEIFLKTKNCVLHVTPNAGCIFSVVGRDDEMKKITEMRMNNNNL